MSKKWFVFAFATMLVGSAFAAEVTPNLDQGTKVLEGAGTINLMSDETAIQLAYGKFVADGIEVGAVAGLFDNDAYMSTELGLRAEYNFVRDSALVPFVSGGVTWSNVEADDNDIDTDAAVFPLGAGLKYFLRDEVALAVNGSYLMATDDIFVDSEDDEVQSDEFRILFSVRYFFD